LRLKGAPQQAPTTSSAKIIFFISLLPPYGCCLASYRRRHQRGASGISKRSKRDTNPPRLIAFMFN
jgi:hypothetical protein